MTLEEFLHTYFKCKTPFLANSTRDDRLYFTKSGAAAYKKLADLLDDLAELTGCDVDELSNALDNLVTGECG